MWHCVVVAQVPFVVDVLQDVVQRDEVFEQGCQVEDQGFEALLITFKLLGVKYTSGGVRICVTVTVVVYVSYWYWLDAWSVTVYIAGDQYV